MTTQVTKTAVIPARFEGLPGLALGGYSSGLLAAAVATPSVTVALRRPVPLDRQLDVVDAGEGRFELREGETLLATGEPAAVEPRIPDPPTPAQAADASSAFTGFAQHPFSRCFACGPDRGDGDGLRVFPGRVPGRPLIAATWTTPAEIEGSHALPLIWSAFDCTQLWALIELGDGRPAERAVTVSLAARVERPLQPGAEHVLIGWAIDREGRRHRAGSALFNADGELCAVGVQVAITAEWGVPLDLVPRSGRPALWESTSTGK